MYVFSPMRKGPAVHPLCHEQGHRSASGPLKVPLHTSSVAIFNLTHCLLPVTPYELAPQTVAAFVRSTHWEPTVHCGAGPHLPASSAMGMSVPGARDVSESQVAPPSRDLALMAPSGSINGPPK